MISSVLLELPCTVDAVAGIGDGLQAGLGNGALALLTLAEAAMLDALESGGDLVEQLLLVLQQAERKLLLEIICAEVRHVDGHVRQVAGGASARPAQGFVRQMGDIAVVAIA